MLDAALVSIFCPGTESDEQQTKQISPCYRRGTHHPYSQIGAKTTNCLQSRKYLFPLPNFWDYF